jgi:hypothetical protein
MHFSLVLVLKNLTIDVTTLVDTERNIHIADVINVHVMLRFTFRLAAAGHIKYLQCKAVS